MEELDDSRRGEGYGPEVCHLVAHRLGVEDHPLWVLHPSVGYEDPYCRDRCPDDREPAGGEVEASADLAPAEEHHSDEGTLHEEGQDTLDSQRSAEDVADEPAIVRPVRPKLELQYDPSGDTDSEVDPEELLPVLGRLLPELIAAAEVLRLRQRHDDT